MRRDEERRRRAGQPRRGGDARRPGRGLLLLALLLGGGPLLGIGSAPRAAELLGIRTWGDVEHFRVVLDLSAAAPHEDRTVTDPDRIAINLRETRAEGLEIPETGDWMVQRIRLNQLSNGTAQVVLDLSAPARWRIFDLGPEGDRPHRVVCDVFRPRERPAPATAAAAGAPAARPAPQPEPKPARESAPAPAPTSEPTPEPPRDWVIVLDPGHGGKDPGVVHRRMQEKEIVLDVSQRVAALLEKEPGIEVHLTRQRDVFVNLSERARRARSEDADLFVSIHVNGYRSGSPRGAEVFFLSREGATDVAAHELALLENAAVTEESDPQLGEIAELPFAVDLLKTDTLRRSSLLAEAVLDQLVNGGLAASRGVKQANFVVLRSCRVPSALVELGFLSNPEDARQLASAEHREALASAIAKGFLEFRSRYARQLHGGNATSSSSAR